MVNRRTTKMKKKVEPYIVLDNPTREEFLKIVANGAKGQRYYIIGGYFDGIKPGELDKPIKFPKKK